MARITVFALTCLSLLFSAEWQARSLAPSAAIVKNPHCGFAFMPRLEPADKFPDWLLDLASIAYFRMPWDEVVNEKGEYDFERLDAQVFSTFRKRGLRLAFRIMPANRFSPRACIFPRAALGRDIPFVKVYLNPDKASEVPVFWSEAYLREHGRLMQALGAWAEKHPELDHVDLGGMGEFGENHFNRWTAAEKAAAGYSDEAYLGAMFRMMAQAEQFLPQVSRALCVSPFDGPTEPMFRLLTERAVRHGWWLRVDSFTDKGPVASSVPLFERFRWRTPWILEASGGINRGYFGEAIPLPKYFDAVRQFQPHVVNLMGMWDLGKLKPEEQQYLAEQGRLIGWRLQFQKVVLPREVAASADGAAVPLSITIAQNGAVPYMGEAVYLLRFTQEGKTVHETLWIPEEPPSTIMPGRKRSERLWVPLPRSLLPKETKLDLALRDLRQGLLRPDNAEVLEGFRVPAGSFMVKAPSPHSGDSEDFLPKLLDAKMPDGMEIGKSADGVVLKGREEKGWSYAMFPGPALKPENVYALRISVRAWKSAIADSKLRVKIGVKKVGERDVRNIFTEAYDFSRAGEWQDLTLSYQPFENEALEVFGVEKGRTAPSMLNAEFRSWLWEARALAPLE